MSAIQLKDISLFENHLKTYIVRCYDIVFSKKELFMWLPTKTCHEFVTYKR